MKILVTTKRVPDTDQKIRVNSEQSAIEDANLVYIINPFDAIALEEALRLRERRDETTEILAVGIGEPDYEEQLRTALAMGADRAMLVHCSQTLDPWNVATILHAIAQREAIDLILMGKQAVDDDSNQAGQFLAAQLAWPQATFASAVKLLDAGLLIERETDKGIESITVDLPAVVTCDLRLNEPRYASLPSILKSKKKPIETVAVESLGIEIAPRIEVLSLESVTSQRQCEFVSSAEDLVAKLRTEATLRPLLVTQH